MTTTGDELRARAQYIDGHRDGWVQGEPDGEGQFCAAYDYGRLGLLSALGDTTMRKLEGWLGGYVDENFDFFLGDYQDRLFPVTEFNDNVANDVDDVIVMLEKAAAELE